MHFVLVLLLNMSFFHINVAKCFYNDTYTDLITPFYLFFPIPYIIFAIFVFK